MDAKLKQSDDLFWGKKYKECDVILDSLKSDPEVHWRKARLIFAQITSSPSEPSKDTLRSTFGKGLEETNKGLSTDPKHANCLTWKGICINQIAKIDGINERIKKAYEIQELWEKALEVDPTNDLTLGCMGIWCFTVTDLPDVKRLFAKTFFKTPPNSTYQEALDFLLKSEKHAERPNIRVHAALAKTYYRLKDTANARVYCEKVLASTDTGYEAAEEKEEVQKILKKI